MKKYFTTLTAIIIFTFTINSYASIGEGISNVGTLSSFNNTNTIIITHGFTSENLFPIPQSLWEHYIWQFAMANAVSNNKDIYLIRKAIVYKIIADTSNFKDYTLNHSSSSIENFISLYGQEQFTPVPNKDNVFIFDWTLESAVNKHGFAEGAADVLASSLVKLGSEYPFILKHLHFIGHSRGCVVNSEAIQRLIYWASNDLLPVGISIDPNIHMTTLDPHPAGHWWRNFFTAMKDDDVNSSNIVYKGKRIGIIGWKNNSNNLMTSYIDNYYENNFILLSNPFIGLDDYPGLNHLNPTANYNLSSILSDQSHAHRFVHIWYHGTISSLDSNDHFNVGTRTIQRSTSWYNNGLGKTEGFFYSLNRVGNLSLINSIEDNLIDVNADRNYSVDKMIFNGNFSKDYSDGPLTGMYNISGWSFQGGTSSELSNVFFNRCAALNENNNLLIHNKMLFPRNKPQIYFNLRVAGTSPNDFLNLYVNDILIRHLPVDHLILTKQLVESIIPNEVQGSVGQIKFELTKTDQDPATVLIDDVSFVPIEELRSTVACPVDFHIYDNLGNHTGPLNDTTIVEEIPGSEYYVYEDSTGDKIKTVYLKPLDGNANYTFVIESQDTTASFSYEIEDYSDTSQGTSLYQFNNIAIEPNTVATCTLDVNVQIPELDVDIDGDGTIDSIYTPVVITSVENDESIVVPIPTQFELFNNFPNPFNPTTSISYSIPEVSNVTLKVYDVLGKEITTLVNEEKSPGNYTVQFDSKNLSSGIYFYTLQTGTYTATKKMILLK